MIEIRIYYECLEQAFFYLRPIVEKALDGNCNIKLIEISTMTSESVIAEALANALAIRNPDGIITVIDNEVEIPLVWIEFTTQVKTLDHMAQSFNSFVAAGSERIPVVKFVAERTSRSAHGGAQTFDNRVPFQILFDSFNTPGIQLEWPVSEDGRFAIRHHLHKACPAYELGLVEILTVCFAGLAKGSKPADALIAFANSESSPIAISMKQNLRKPNAFVPAPRSTRFYRNGGEWTIKFNRWGHSMDPERGLCELMFHWLQTKLVGRINDPEATNSFEALNNFKRATGIKVPVGDHKKINITDVISISNVNRAGLIILWCCNSFTICSKSGKELVTLFWDAKKPDGLKNIFRTAAQTEIYSKDFITEDEVTFVVANRILLENNFNVHSVSYPGAQGDFALLTGSGRAVKRKYFDVISVKNVNGKDFVLLTESKGEVTSSIIASDVKNVLDWNYDNALRKVLLGDMGKDSDSKIISSIAYIADDLIDCDRSDELDFVVLVSPKEWKIECNQLHSDLGLTVIEGKSDLPIRHKY